jgi:transcriptional regulator with XRE-family HTH domain
MSQKEFADHLGVHKNTWARYERGERSVDADVLIALRARDVNPNWVLTGEGPKMLSELEPAEPSAWSPDLMRQVIEGVEIALDRNDREMSPEDKASLILSVYELYADAGAQPDRGKIIKMVSSAAA